MAATHSEYRGYLRNTVDIEAGQHRLHPVQSSEPTYRPLLFGTLTIMGLLQVASSVAILLHLTGYLQEVDLSTAPRRSIEEVQPEPVLDALRDTRKSKRCKTKEGLPSAHLPIRAQHEYSKSEPKTLTIEWNEEHGYLHRMDYQKGKLLVQDSGLYYVYAKTCFRYYRPREDSSPAEDPPVDLSNTQLIQYVYHESIKQNSKSVTLMKTGSTMRWNSTSYNMYCAQQGRGIHLEVGDTLFVNVSNAWMLDRDGEGTYFGAIKLGN
ncbi:tumor necrosis factor ligand superfamily member 11 isoform X2 [Micropterus salmoides]|uniref:tumor necrosis factor ligand superfamily member 11-like isoform X2 n=1 Tax=Micropterus salmoides TaxID=27706 RepID=UPI0018EDB397|nr:tumor necrosis factor ligand superfamily member 11-like isoform X2 [Micropterus salmoides]XP_038577301.1 tumor necrosis factor ligand superfamily member 11 isoform X2 [Micropterus salmoides]XP_045910058.1 tumor necrosis factor ligand superfamily member 11 isoform X2 [Micropterus dolomieu]